MLRLATQPLPFARTEGSGDELRGVPGCCVLVSSLEPNLRAESFGVWS